MRPLILLLCLLALNGCSDDTETSDYTGEQQSYAMVQASDFPINGTVTFLERRDNTTEIQIKLTGTEGDISHPTHLHYGDFSTPDAEMAAQLTPVFGKTGESITIIEALIDETPITYDELINFEGHIKVHLDGGPNKSTILAAGDIGSASKSSNSGRRSIAVCKSE
ncbi:hypothetical protein [Fulvivirga lutimaris]|uniref:hypothetical protein n=1 Tax=Fulvivirga lutimaris TaxID=1819566 RepID=UPI0012BC56A8|nr:hypothetical protein [Fulvivirga lutimaris]MTI40410.1 hypothetical protein [Fulvivirga lutimaris]